MSHKQQFELVAAAFAGRAGGLSWIGTLGAWARSLDAEADDIETEEIRLDIRAREIVTARAVLAERKNALEVEQRNFRVATEAATAATLQTAAQSNNRQIVGHTEENRRNDN